MPQAQKQHQHSVAELNKIADDAVQNVLILNPRLPAVNVAQLALEELESPVFAELSRAALAKDLASRAGRQRAADRRGEREKQLDLTFHVPELRDHVKKLPVRLQRPDTELAQLFDLIKERGSRLRDRRDTDPVIAAAKDLMLKFDQVRPPIRAVLDAHEIKYDGPTCEKEFDVLRSALARLEEK